MLIDPKCARHASAGFPGRATCIVGLCDQITPCSRMKGGSYGVGDLFLLFRFYKVVSF